MIYGEVGKLPLQVSVDRHLISYWLRILDKDENTLAHIMYMIALHLFFRDEYKTIWLCRVKCILDNCGLSYMWCDQHVINTQQCKLIIHTRIEDIALHKWYTDISTSSMCILYRTFRKQLDFEKYLLISDYSERFSLSKLRCANIKLPVYSEIFMFDTDVCTLCDLCITGDEYHYIMTYHFFTQSREDISKPCFNIIQM